MRKALRMLRESNCGVLEWLYAPLLYCAAPDFLAGTHSTHTPRTAFLTAHTLSSPPCSEARALAERDVSWKAVAFHYLNQARKHVDEYFLPRFGAVVPHKKYLYVLRPLLCVLWMRAEAGASSAAALRLPPASWDALVARVAPALSAEEHAALESLAQRKRGVPGTEPLGSGPRLSVIGTCSLPVALHCVVFDPPHAHSVSQRASWSARCRRPTPSRPRS